MFSLGCGVFLERVRTAPLLAGQIACSGSVPRGFHPPTASHITFLSGRFRCGLRRAGTRKPLWKRSDMTREAIQAVQSLKLARRKLLPQAGNLEGAPQDKVARLIKADMIAVLAELQRQNEWELALQIFEYIRQEQWYQPDLSLYCDMIYMAGKNELTEVAERLFSEIKKDGLQPDTRAYNEIIGVYLKAGRIEKALEAYGCLKGSGCSPDELTFTILIRNLQKAGEPSIASSLMKECEDILEHPERFLEEVNKKFPKRRPVKLV